MADRPNILFIFTDQQSSRMMSCAGNPWLSTPAMDSIAAAGTRFDRAYCTDPVCVPSRFSLMTGRMPSAIGLRSNSARHIDGIPEEITRDGLGYLLQRAGYETVYGGKTHLPKMTAEDVGFRYLTHDERDGLAETTAEYLRQDHDRPFMLVSSFINPHDICYMAIRDFMESEHERRLVEKGAVETATLDEALRLPEGVSREEFFATHCPPLPDNHLPQEHEPQAIRDLVAQRPFRRKAREHYTDEQWRMHRWAYCRLTEAVDRQIGVVLDALREGPHADNTLVIFSSDHGDMDSAHKMEHKTAFYDEACRVPLVVSWPGHVREGVVDSDTLVSNGLDLLPTLCDYAGVTIPDWVEGRSFRAAAEGHRPPSREVLPVESEIGRMLLGRRFKYMRFDDGEHAEQLIDLERDPLETRNATADLEHADVLASMRTLYGQRVWQL